MIVGVALQPIGWIFLPWVTIVSFVAIALGVLLAFASWRGDDGMEGGSSSIEFTGRELPGDIHGYSAQMSGGRSTSWESSHSDHGGGHSDASE